MRADEIMTTPVVTVLVSADVREAVALLAEHHIGSMPVLDDSGALVGIVSELDLLGNRMPHDPRSHIRPHSADHDDPKRRVGDVMHTAVVCVPGSADTSDLASVMVEKNIRAVPVVDGPTLVGIVSRRDVLRTLLRDDSGIHADVSALLGDYSPEDSWTVDVDQGVVTVHGHFGDDHQRRTVEALARSVPAVVRVHLHEIDS